MVCFGKAKWKREAVADHKFDFIDVRDYYSNTFFMRFKYMLLYVLVIKSVAVYVADIYTAVTLLALNHFFSGNVYNRVADNLQFNYFKWIFSGCIIFSFLLLAYEAHKSRQVVRSRDISYAYTNVMANNYYSLRSYDHFCFFSQINNSKKKKDELAFFIFFTFKGWKRLLVADGPRQVINGLTLFWIAKASNFSTNLYDYYQGNYFSAIMLLTMVFTVVIFASSAILLILAAMMYIPLICYIQGNLKDYCCHKIDKRISELVQKKKKQRLGKYAAIARAEAAGDFSHLMNKQGIIIRQKMVQPTLPNLDVNLSEDDKKPFKGHAMYRTASMSSSTANGFQGAEKGFYGMKEGDDYASSAHLMKNQGYAGSLFGHAMHGTNLSVSSGTLIQSGPGTSHSSPDAYPVHVRGMQNGQVPNNMGMANALASMGPIGTSPALFAQRKVGLTQGNAHDYGVAQGGAAGDAYEMTHPQMHEQYDQQPYEYGFNPNADPSYPAAAYGHEQQQYPEIRVNPSEMDISAYAPYEHRGDDNHADHAASRDQLDVSRDASRVQSFAFGDVYDDYLNEPQDGQVRDSYDRRSPVSRHDAFSYQNYASASPQREHFDDEYTGQAYGHVQHDGVQHQQDGYGNDAGYGVDHMGIEPQAQHYSQQQHQGDLGHAMYAHSEYDQNNQDRAGHDYIDGHYQQPQQDAYYAHHQQHAADVSAYPQGGYTAGYDAR